jgi:uncharacterized protein (UPF0548 family)
VFGKGIGSLESGMQLLILRWGIEKDAHGETTLSTRPVLLILIMSLRKGGRLLNVSAPRWVIKCDGGASYPLVQLAMHQQS